MRVLAVDLGSSRVGVALSDPTGTIAQPLEVILRRGRAGVIGRIAGLVDQHQVDRIVVGLPLRMDGTEGAEAAAARVFAARLAEAVAVPVEMHDERLSTAEAERAMLEGDASRARRRARRDAVAAALILQSYLEKPRDTPNDGSRDSGIETAE